MIYGAFEIQPESSFLRLPGELRNYIYKYVFAGHTARSKDVPLPLGHEKVGWVYPMHVLSLSQTCRQIHAETRYMPFEGGEFTGKAADVINQLGHKLSPARASLISTVRLEFHQHAVIHDSDLLNILNPEFDCMLKNLALLPRIKLVTVELKQWFHRALFEQCEIYGNIARSLATERMKDLGRHDVELMIILEYSTVPAALHDNQ